MIKDKDKLLAIMNECLSHDVRSELSDLCRYRRKNSNIYDYELYTSKDSTEEQKKQNREMMEDLEWLEDNL
jgi:hypothetical protein